METEGKKREWPKKRDNYAVRNETKSDMGKTDQQKIKETEVGKWNAQVRRQKS